MPKIAYAEPDETALLARIRAARGGRLPHLFAMLLHSPALAEGWFDFMTAVRKSSLDGRTRELAILQAALSLRATYPQVDHVPIALKEGVSQAEIDALLQGRAAEAFAGRDLAVIDYARTMTENVQVAPETFAPLRLFFSDAEIVELTVLIGAYNMVGRVLEALDVDLETA
jgi:alkylhydroperoxidase family enzyme